MPIECFFLQFLFVYTDRAHCFFFLSFVYAKGMKESHRYNYIKQLYAQNKNRNFIICIIKKEK